MYFYLDVFHGKNGGGSFPFVESLPWNSKFWNDNANFIGSSNVNLLVFISAWKTHYRAPISRWYRNQWFEIRWKWFVRHHAFLWSPCSQVFAAWGDPNRSKYFIEKSIIRRRAMALQTRRSGGGSFPFCKNHPREESIYKNRSFMEIRTRAQWWSRVYS